MGNCYLSRTIPSDTLFYSLQGQNIKCRVVKVIDGDTIHVVFYNPCFHKKSPAYKYIVRLYGIDAPELHPLKKLNNRDEIIKKANESRIALENKINGKIVNIIFNKKDKYGREMGNVYLDGIDINLWMINNGYAISYYGGKKK